MKVSGVWIVGEGRWEWEIGDRMMNFPLFRFRLGIQMSFCFPLLHKSYSYLVHVISLSLSQAPSKRHFGDVIVVTYLLMLFSCINGCSFNVSCLETTHFFLW